MNSQPQTQTVDSAPRATVIEYAAQQLNRNQKRHAKQAIEYADAVKSQGRRYVKGFHSNPKHPMPHLGEKQKAKLLAKLQKNCEAQDRNAAQP